VLDCQLYGLWPGGHHLTSVLLHVGATLLLLGMLCALTGEPAPSAFVAGAFALHPLRAESVAWVSERKDVLAAVLWMSTMWLVHSNLGFLLAAQGNLDEAVDHYAAALREDPNLAPAHNNLGLALESLGRRDEALRHYSRAVELAPADLQNRLNYARAPARSGRRGDAIGELREVLRRQPDWPPAEQASPALTGAPRGVVGGERVARQVRKGGLEPPRVFSLAAERAGPPLLPSCSFEEEGRCTRRAPHAALTAPTPIGHP